MRSQWRRFLGPRVLPLNDPKASVDVMLGAIALVAQTRTLLEFLQDLDARGQDAARKKAPGRGGRGSKKTRVASLGSGRASARPGGRRSPWTGSAGVSAARFKSFGHQQLSVARAFCCARQAMRSF